MSRRLLIIAVAITVIATAAGIGAGVAAASGPSPGVSAGWDGIATPNGQFRYVTLPGTNETELAVIRTRDGRVLRYGTLAGSFGIPMVTYSGTTDGLSRDGRSLVLETPPPATTTTSFAIVDTKKLSVRQQIVLKGTWSFDALSPDAHTMYLIQYLQTPDTIHYRVRAYDLPGNRLIAGAIVDPTEKGPMTGQPVARTRSRNGAWAYTLYMGASPGKPFIHALDTVHRRAVCIDLDWHGTANELSRIRLTLSADEQHLVLRRPADGKPMLTIAAPR
jgi:hypothetical protein